MLAQNPSRDALRGRMWVGADRRAALEEDPILANNIVVIDDHGLRSFEPSGLSSADDPLGFPASRKIV